MATFPARVQARLAQTYGLDETPAVDDFIEPTDNADREALFIREVDDGVELIVHLPRRAIEESRSMSVDDVCQVVEGVSHFLYVVERARRGLPTTQLELELQAEIDKYVLLAHGGAVGERGYDPTRAPRVRRVLFEQVTFVHAADTEHGERYRIANGLAARFVRRLEEAFARRGRFEQMRTLLRRFYFAGQAEKLELAQAA